MNAAHNKWWQIGEVVFGIPIFIAVLLEWVAPIACPYGLFTPGILAAGTGLIVTGILFIVLGRGELAHQNQPTDPGQPTTGIVTSGVFSISRNPLYLGAVLLLVGAGMVFHYLWLVIWVLPAMTACHFILIVPEEKYLSVKFNGEYQRYIDQVRRWIGKSRKI